MPGPSEPVLILGAGINGAALARELLLQGVGVVLVDVADVCSGASAASSRLIHGGLRYLEYGELSLVRESLRERELLLQLAPHQVHPLQLFIPLNTRFSGFGAAVAKLLHLPQRQKPAGPTPRGLWVVRCGLWLYDLLARSRSLGRHGIHRPGEMNTPQVDQRRYRWLGSYFDAQVPWTERYVVALLEDARQIAQERHLTCEVYPYHRAIRHHEHIALHPSPGTNCASPVAAEGSSSPAAAFPVSSSAESPVRCWTPSAVINATGAWVDLTNSQLELSSQRLMGGTKGSHFWTQQDQLCRRLGRQGIYAEADDGRPIFLLPLAGGVLVGTTDLPFEGDPRHVRATPDELDYLLAAVHRVMGDIGLTAADINWHYCGVRPLPYVHAQTTAAITRRHALVLHPAAPWPSYSVVGGKLTTSRSLAEETARTLLARWQMPYRPESRQRPVPGSDAWPGSDAAIDAACQALAQQRGWSLAQIRTGWKLYGTRLSAVISQLPRPPLDNLAGTHLPVELARYCIRHEWATTLSDLVLRRLMLLFEPEFSRSGLRQLAAVLVEEGQMTAAESTTAIAQVTQELSDRFGKRLPE